MENEDTIKNMDHMLSRLDDHMQKMDQEFSNIKSTLIKLMDKMGIPTDEYKNSEESTVRDEIDCGTTQLKKEGFDQDNQEVTTTNEFIRFLKEDFPCFFEGDLEEWMRQCGRLFVLEETPENIKRRWVIVCLKGNALEWHNNFLTNNNDTIDELHWMDYLRMVFKDFDSTPKVFDEMCKRVNNELKENSGDQIRELSDQESFDANGFKEYEKENEMALRSCMTFDMGFDQKIINNDPVYLDLLGGEMVDEASQILEDKSEDSIVNSNHGIALKAIVKDKEVGVINTNKIWQFSSALIIVKKFEWKPGWNCVEIEFWGYKFSYSIDLWQEHIVYFIQEDVEDSNIYIRHDQILEEDLNKTTLKCDGLSYSYLYWLGSKRTRITDVLEQQSLSHQHYCISSKCVGLGVATDVTVLSSKGGCNQPKNSRTSWLNKFQGYVGPLLKGSKDGQHNNGSNVVTETSTVAYSPGQQWAGMAITSQQPGMLLSGCDKVERAAEWVSRTADGLGLRLAAAAQWVSRAVQSVFALEQLMGQDGSVLVFDTCD